MLTKLLIGAALATILLSLPSAVLADRKLGKYETAVGQAAAAYIASTTCKGVHAIGGGDYQQFVFQVSDILKAQGLRENKVRRLLFYGKQDKLGGMAFSVLRERGVALDEDAQLCAFAKKVAGTGDAIGRFLK
jgi:hypothetical protein